MFSTTFSAVIGTGKLHTEDGIGISWRKTEWWDHNGCAAMHRAERLFPKLHCFHPKLFHLFLPPISYSWVWVVTHQIYFRPTELLFRNL